MFGDLEKTYSVIFSEKICRRFGEIVRRFWRKPFGDNFGDLEKTYLAKSWSLIFVLEIGMEYCSARRPYMEIKTQWRKNGDKLWRPKLYSSQSREYISGAFQG